jgi:hypothetical protein
MILPSRPFGVIASSRPRVIAVAAAIVAPDPALNFTDTLGNTDVDPCQDYTEEQVLGITETITLTFTVTATSGGGDPIVYYRKASTPASSTVIYCDSGNGYGGTPTPEGTSQVGDGSDDWYYLYNGATLLVSSITVSAGDYLAFVAIGNAPPFDPGSITIRINNETDDNAVIDTILFQQNGCFLTTAVVRHMGLLDDGPELTAMRLLREYYRDVPGYNELIQEYYTNSSAIIGAINASNNASVEYDYIYNTVTAVMNHVNAEEWQQAHDLYLALYNDLKDRYLG